jgi:PAS domain S-box-containing protein
VDYFILPPQGSFAIATLADAVAMAFFSGMGVFMSVLGELYRRARQMAAAREPEDSWHKDDRAASRWLGQGLMVNIGMVSSLAILTLAGSLCVRDLRAVAAADRWEMHTRVVIEEFERLLSVFKGAETGQRGYLLTGEEKYLEPYNEALGLVQTYLLDLKQLTLDNAAQQQRLDKLQALGLEKTAELKRTIELRRTQGLPAALAVVTSDTGKKLMDQIRLEVIQGEAEEERLLQQRTDAKNTGAGKTLQVLLAGGILGVLMLATVFFHLKRENIRRTQAEAELRHHRDHLQELVAARTGELSRTNEHLTEAIAEHQQAREALRQQREWLRVTLTSIGDAVLATDTDGQVTFLNPVAEGLTGWAENAALGQPVETIFRIINEQSRAPGQDIVHQVLRDGQTVALANHTALIARDGRQIPIEDSAAPIKDHQGIVSGVVLVFHDVTQKRRAREALRQSEARFAAFAAATFEGIVELEAGRIVDCNEPLAQMLGWTVQELKGKVLMDLVPEADRALVRENVQTGPDTFAEHALVRQDGTSLFVEVRARQLSAESPRRLKVIRDITERRQAEETLQRLNRTLRALGRSSQAMLHATDEAGYLNEVCRVITECGYAMVWVGFAENDAARSVRPVAHGGFEASYLETLNVTWADTERGRGPTGTAIRTGQPAVCRDMRTDENFGPWRTEALKRGFAASLVLPLLESGKTFGAVTIYSHEPGAFPPDEVQLLAEVAADLAHGISVLRHAVERRRAEDQMRLQSAALEAAANAIVITDPKGIIQWVNPAFTRLTGYSAAEALGQNPRVLKSGAHPPEFYRDLWRTVLAGRVWHSEIVNKRKDGSCYTEEMIITPVLDSGGAVVNFIAIKPDVTERKQAEAALAQAKAALERQNRELEQTVAARTASLRQALTEMERFAYVASHDLQEPLRTVASFSQLLARRYEGKLDADADEFIHFIVDGATRMQALINDLLALSRIETRGKTFGPVDCEELLQAVRENLNAAIAESGAVITHDPLPVLFGDRTQLTQLLQNLFSNAIKFRRPAAPPQIHVSAARQDGGWRLSVRDNGIGIDPQFFERIFIIFQRLHNRDEYPGTGIGLAICKKIVERHGGRLWVESAPGSGSTFQFTIPDGKQNHE